MTSSPASGGRRQQQPDEAPGESARTPLSVSVLAQATREIVEGSLPPLWVQGEVTGFKRHANGHWYFSLRDQRSRVDCVVWASDARRIPAVPDEGMTVVVRGSLTVFPERTQLQLRVRELQGVGDGLWRKAFDETRRRLTADGLLDPARKRRLPLLPRRIAVITSTDGAALRDIVSVVQRRCPSVEIVVLPATVQGEAAPESLVAALQLATRWRKAHVLIIGRGGGSREDLWAFNDERVARALAACPMPTVSAVGHETDVTICDLIADRRAATPSAAAEAAVPVLAEIAQRVRAQGRSMQRAMTERVEESQLRLGTAARHAARAAERLVERGGLRRDGLAGRLHALSPLATLGRGYVLAYASDGTVRVRASQVQAGDDLTIRFRDGAARTVVQAVEHIAPREGP